MATLSQNTLSSIRPLAAPPRPREPAAQAPRAAVGLRRRLRRLRRRRAPRPAASPTTRRSTRSAARRGVRLDRPARARPRSRSRPSPRPSACTSWPSRTPCTRHQRPKLERYDDTLFMVLKTVTLRRARRADHRHRDVETGEVMAFVGPDFIVTVRHGEHCGLHRRAREAGGRPGAARARARRRAARDRRPHRRPVRRGHRRHRGRHRRDRGRGLRAALGAWTPSRSTS